MVHPSAQKPGADTKPIRVLLVIDMSLLRGALATVLSSEDDIEVVAGMAAGDRVVATAIRHQPDIAVLDLDQGRSAVLATAQALPERLPGRRSPVPAAAPRPGWVHPALSSPVARALDTDAQPRRVLTRTRPVATGNRTRCRPRPGLP
mgnify:CR=1 FL=1